MEQNIVDALTMGGMDVPVTVERFGGNENLLLKYLCRLPEDPSFQALESAMRTGDRELARAHCHTLKGISGNLGLTPLFTACIAMMTVLRTEDDGALVASFDQLSEKYRQAIVLVQSIG